MDFPFSSQFATEIRNNCGSHCLKMICDYYETYYNLEYLDGLCNLSENGISTLSLIQGAESLGFSTLAVNIDILTLSSVIETNLCILHLNYGHYVVAYGNQTDDNGKGSYLKIADPALGLIKMSLEEVKRSWYPLYFKSEQGLAIVFESFFGVRALKEDFLKDPPKSPHKDYRYI